MSLSAMDRRAAPRSVEQLLIGDSNVMIALRRQVVRAARTALPVLIEGPSGAGKELVAQGLHIESGRGGRFVAFNVCAISDGMFEDAIFGHVRGAFSGAVASNEGYCEEASGGSLFLDEIGALGLSHQSKLLRVVETKMYRKVGASVDRHSDFRLISATNVSLEQLVRAGQFRNDLLHRLAGIVIRVPTLEEHLEDIPLLVKHFAEGLTAPGHVRPSFSANALALLGSRRWPGNIRELKLAVERAIVFASTPSIGAGDVRMVTESAPEMLDCESPPERQRILEALIECEWDTMRAASLLNVNRSTLYRMIKRMRLRRGEATNLGDAMSLVRPVDVEPDAHEMRIRANSHPFAANEGESANVPSS